MAWNVIRGSLGLLNDGCLNVFTKQDTSYAAPQNHTPRSWKASSSVVATIETADTALAIVAPRSHGGRPGSSLVYIRLPKRCSLS
jgi:hypothetical protein